MCKMDKLWTLESALPVIKRIADVAEEHGFDVALYGSVLRREYSENDLDLFFVVAETRTTTVHART